MRFLAPLLLATLALADTVHMKGGKKIHGAVVAEEPEVVVNPFRSTLPGMTLGVQRFPREKVKSIDRTPPPEQEFQRRLLEAKDAAAALELADWCAAQKLRDEEEYALEIVLRLDPAHEGARKRLGQKAPKGSWADDVALAREYLEADETAREGILLRIRARPAFPFDERTLRRAWRSAREKKGYQKDRMVALRADKLAENARYTLLVPESYDPLLPTPLVVGLHGGGAGGADGKLVVGSGAEAMNFYQRLCEARGWICACPTAAEAGWRSRMNDDLIDAMLEELLALYHIDENRIYLVGHSMGGGGTWAQGSRLPETWAAIAPASSYGVDGISALEKTRTGFYVYHSDDDPRCPVDGVRPAMQNLLGTDTDFVYTELPKRGHDFPQEVVEDIFRFFDARTLGRKPRFRPQVRPLSSFARKVSRDEKKYLPPLGEAEAGDESLSDLLKDLKTGGGVAEQAVPRLVVCADPKTSSAVAKILLRPDAGSDVRRYAARVLGGRKAAEELDTLGRVLLVEEEANALLEMLAAVGEINDPKGGEAVLRFLKRRGEYLAKRTQGGVLSQSDWETILPTMTRACELLGTFAPPKAAAQIAATVVDAVLLDGPAVRFDTENQRPLPYAQALAEAACGALGRLGGADAVAALERMWKAREGGASPLVRPVYGPVSDISGWARDPRIEGFVQEALAKLR